MALDRTWYHTLVDDSGDGISGSVWDKADVDALMDAIDAELQPVHCSVSRSTGVGDTVSHATWTIASYDLVHRELPGPAGSMFTPGQGHILVPAGKSGIYLVTAACTFGVHVTGVRSATIYVDGAPTFGRAAQEMLVDAQQRTFSTLHTSAVIALQAGQYIQLAVFHTAGVALQVGGFGPNATNSLQLTRLSAAV